jgi:hypothetical protein
MPLIMAGCKHVKPDDACGLVAKADVEKVLGAPVTYVVIEPAHAMSMSQGRVMQSSASCSYSLDPGLGRPARIKIQVDVFGDHGMTVVNFNRWNGAQHVDSIGDDAWQDTTALEILKKDTVLVIETDQTSESPQQPVPPSAETKTYPGIQVALARIALGRM